MNNSKEDVRNTITEEYSVFVYLFTVSSLVSLRLQAQFLILERKRLICFLQDRYAK